MLVAHQWLVAALSTILGAAAISKMDDWRGWSNASARLFSGRVASRGVRLLLPAGEAGTAAILVFRPIVGLAMTVALFAVLTAGAAWLARSHSGTICACFGSLMRGTIGRRLVMRNTALLFAATGVLATSSSDTTNRIIPIPLLLTAALVVLGAMLLPALREMQEQAQRKGVNAVG